MDAHPFGMRLGADFDNCCELVGADNGCRDRIIKLCDSGLEFQFEGGELGSDIRGPDARKISYLDFTMFEAGFATKPAYIGGMRYRQRPHSLFLPCASHFNGRRFPLYGIVAGSAKYSDQIAMGLWTV